jgi:hypothetical protein
MPSDPPSHFALRRRKKETDMTFKRQAFPIALAAGLALVFGMTKPAAVTADGDGPALCSNRTLRGDYGFNVDGQIFPPGGPPLVLRGVAMTTFDGHGGLTQVDHATVNGVPRWQGWRPAVGTYELNPDCTGTGEIIPSDGGPTIRLHMVVFDRGRQVRTVVDGNATGSLGVRVR